MSRAQNIGAHAEGYNTRANGQFAHSEGTSTIATMSNSHAQGRYNVEDTTNTYVDIVGWGDSDTARKNISALDINGNLHLKGDIYIGCNNDSSGGKSLESILGDIETILDRLTRGDGV